MIFYLTRTMLCMAVFLLAYLLFLEKEKMHRFNRWYLLGSICCSFIIPLIIIRIAAPAIPALTENYITSSPAFSDRTSQPSIHVIPVTPEANYLIPGLIILYAGITGFLLFRFIRNINKLISRISTNETLPYKGARLVLLKHETVSHTFLNTIFISAEDHYSNRIEEEVLIHELAHAKQKHSLDVLFMELLQVFFWFNPLLILYKKAVQLNHEFLADDAVIGSCNNITGYQELLFTKATMNSQYKLASGFTYSVTRKRLRMMTRTTSRFMAFLKQFFVLPLLAGAIFLFATKNIIAQDTPTKASPNLTAKPSGAGNVDHVFPYALIMKTPFTKEGVSKEVYADYKATEQKYITVAKNPYEEFDFNRMSDAERNRLETIFKKMSREQQRRCQLFFIAPMGPIKAEPPTNEQLNRWRNNKIYRVSLDGKRLSTEELEQYKASDFASAIVDTKKSLDKKNGSTYTHHVSLSSWMSHKENNTRLRAQKNFGIGYISAHTIAGVKDNKLKQLK